MTKIWSTSAGCLKSSGIFALNLRIFPAKCACLKNCGERERERERVS